MLIVFCVERPSEEGAPLGWGIELCGSSSCLGGLRSLMNSEGILTLPMSLPITKCHLLQKVFKLQVLWSSHQFIKQG